MPQPLAKRGLGDGVDTQVSDRLRSYCALVSVPHAVLRNGMGHPRGLKGAMPKLEARACDRFIKRHGRCA